MFSKEEKLFLEGLKFLGGKCNRESIRKYIEKELGRDFSDVELRTIKRNLVIKHKLPIGGDSKQGYYFIKNKRDLDASILEINEKIKGLLELKKSLIEGYNKIFGNKND